jgi:CheY-like chemotaxis protein
MMLRADLSHGNREITAHTTTLATDSVCVRTDEALSVGDRVGVRLSFRRLLAPVLFETHVVSKDAGSGLGYFPTVTLAFDALTIAQREWIAALLEVPAASSSAETCRILVVEDSALMRDFVQVSGDRAPRVEVVTVDSAESALALVGDQRYELALIDLFLPGMSGADLVRTLKARGDADLAMIGFSIGGASARNAFLSAGADMFLDKPVMVKDLFATVVTLGNARKGLA